jgi:hypothetical protein
VLVSCVVFAGDGGPAGFEAEWAHPRGLVAVGEEASASGGRFLAFGAGTRRPDLPAFPGAEGFGTTTTGGRGGRVLEVTNLADAGPGSFRAAVEASGPRFVVFRTGGTIELDDDIKVTEPYLTVAGQTAPGDGITLRADFEQADSGLMDIHTHDVVIRFLRFRSGSFDGENEGNPLTIYEEGAYHVVIDHSSFSWGVNENLTTYDYGRDITLSWNIISEGLGRAGHPEGEHSRGLFMSGTGSGDISAHHNLIAHNNQRNPEINTAGTADFVNNVIYNWGERAGTVSDKNGGLPLNFVGNYFKAGPSSHPDVSELDIYHRDDECEGTLRIHASGNIGPNRSTAEEAEDAVIEPDDCVEFIATRHPAPPVTTTSADGALEDVLAGAGAGVPARDAVDQRVVDEVRNGSGGLIDSPSEVGGWPSLDPGQPSADGDHDGMPDGWETERGLNRTLDDSAGDRNGDGYTNVEEYVNGLVSVTAASSCPEEDAVATATVSVDVTEAGSYGIWSRVRSPGGVVRGYVLRIDGRCHAVSARTDDGEWRWARHGAGEARGAVDLASETHEVTLFGTEPGLELDRVLLTDDPDCVPSGPTADC